MISHLDPRCCWCKKTDLPDAASESNPVLEDQTIVKLLMKLLELPSSFLKTDVTSQLCHDCTKLVYPTAVFTILLELAGTQSAEEYLRQQLQQSKLKLKNRTKKIHSDGTEKAEVESSFGRQLSDYLQSTICHPSSADETCQVFELYTEDNSAGENENGAKLSQEKQMMPKTYSKRRSPKPSVLKSARNRPKVTSSTKATTTNSPPRAVAETLPTSTSVTATCLTQAPASSTALVPVLPTCPDSSAETPVIVSVSSAPVDNQTDSKRRGRYMPDESTYSFEGDWNNELQEVIQSPKKLLWAPSFEALDAFKFISVNKAEKIVTCNICRDTQFSFITSGKKEKKSLIFCKLKAKILKHVISESAGRPIIKCKSLSEICQHFPFSKTKGGLKCDWCVDSTRIFKFEGSLHVRPKTKRIATFLYNLKQHLEGKTHKANAPESTMTSKSIQDNDTKIPSGKRRREFVCEVCGRIYFTEYRLKSHRTRLHTGDGGAEAS